MASIFILRQFTEKDRHIIDSITAKSVNAIKIKALLATYGMGYDFVRFYGSEDGSVVICNVDNVATVYIKSEQNMKELAEFLSLISSDIIAECEIPLVGYSCEKGGVYCHDSVEKKRLDNVSNGLQDAYEVLCEVFPGAVNTATYANWYTNNSFRVRHGMSTLYTYRGMASATAYCTANSTVLLTHLGTCTAARGQGYARALVQHIAEDKQADYILLRSQNEQSDRFYEHVGFKRVEEWRIYERKR